MIATVSALFGPHSIFQPVMAPLRFKRSTTMSKPTMPTTEHPPIAKLAVPLPAETSLTKFPAEDLDSRPKVPPSMYVVLRSNSGTPERLIADNDEQAMDRIRKEVRAGQAQVVYCYKLFCAEEFVPHSVTTSAEEIERRINNKENPT